ncbi:hypothetical protein GW17_00049036 [Ensete ventricosum]|nr:hypothetical protein GW17_00049036 [Ensete ventricosum]
MRQENPLFENPEFWNDGLSPRGAVPEVGEGSDLCKVRKYRGLSFNRTIGIPLKKGTASLKNSARLAACRRAATLFLRG